MALVQAAAAFAVAMILLSTVVSGICEVIVRGLALRAEVLVQMLGRLVAAEIAPRQTGDGMPGGAQAALVTALSRNPVADLDDDPGPLTRLWRWLRPGRVPVNSLSTFAFLQRLAKTEVGARLAGEADEALRDILDDLSRTYERYAAASREEFRKRAQMIAILVALALAFGMNVGAVRLAQHLATDEPARAALLAAAEEAHRANEAAVARLEAAKTEGSPAAAASTAALDEAVDRIEASFAELAELRLPIGWGEQAPELGSGAPALVRWFLDTLLAGILIGLGGPFWYRVYSNLSQFVPILGQLGGGNRELVAQPTEEAPETGKAIRAEDIVAIFRTAARPWTLPAGAP